MNVNSISALLLAYSHKLSRLIHGENAPLLLGEILTDLSNHLGTGNSEFLILENRSERFHIICSTSEIEDKNSANTFSLTCLGYQNTASITQRVYEHTNANALFMGGNSKRRIDYPFFDEEKLIGFLIGFVPVNVPSLTALQHNLITGLGNFAACALQAKKNAQTTGEKLRSLERSNDKFSAFIRVMPDIALIISDEGEYKDIHGAPTSKLYRDAKQIIGLRVSDIFPPDETDKILSVIQRALVTGSIQEYEYPVLSDEGITIFEGRITPINYATAENHAGRHVLWMARDITLDKENQAEIDRLAYFDPLTHLPNRRMLNERLQVAVKGKILSEEYGAVLFLDLDEFKRINDSLGHSAGDALLQEVATRLKNTLRQSDMLARIGGDEFVIIIDNVGDSVEQANNEISVVAKKVHSAFNDTFEIDNLAFNVSCSIGICLIDGKSSADSIMKFADTAMYNSKRQGGGSYSFYDPKRQTLLDRQLTYESDIVRAIENREFCAYFQPQIDNKGRLCGAESLIRWHHPDKGQIPPNEFISIAEQFGLIQKLQDIVLEDMCKLITALTKDGPLPSYFKISINISHSQFKSPNLLNHLLAIVNSHNVSPNTVILEITESMLSHDMEKTVAQMNEIAAEGFIFSIDDFGTGYSSLSNLHSYPVEELKIDKTFIDRIEDAAGLSIVETIIALARNLKMEVVAEGVEKASQLAVLQNYNVDILQGYHFSKPLPMQEYIRWHQEFNSTPRFE